MGRKGNERFDLGEIIVILSLINMDWGDLMLLFIT
jgi:hypothetical protein